MGKSLRNKQIFDETDEEVNQHLIVSLLAKSATRIYLRTITSKKWRKSVSTQNKKRKFRKRTRNGSLGELIDETQLECPFCLELMIVPTMKNCGHLYCYRCLMSHSQHSKRCCICREQSPKQSYIHSTLAESIINEIVLPKSKNYIKYLCRTTDSSEWIKRRKVNNLRVGLVVDYCDMFEVWRRGIVYRIFSQHNKDMAEVRINIKGEEFVENVEITSNKLAPYTFFTRARYLLDFVPSLPELQPAQNDFFLSEFQRFNEEQQFFLGERIDNINEPQQDEVVMISATNSIVQQALDVLNFNIAESFQMLG